MIITTGSTTTTTFFIGAHYAQQISQTRVRQIITAIGFIIAAVTFYKEFLD